MTDVERARLDRLAHWTKEGNGYFQMQATRPQTLAAGLSDSPVGLLAWIGDAFKQWAQGGVTAEDLTIDRDVVLANISIYWFTNTIGSSIRAYYEDMHAAADWESDATGDNAAEWGGEEAAWGEPQRTPYGVAAFAEDIAIRRYGEQMYNIVHWSDFERGGHFAALEAPDLLVQDVRAFFGSLEGE